MSGKTFYDIHIHSMNLSHPYLLAFIQRINLDKILFLNSIPVIGSLISFFASTSVVRVKKKRTVFVLPILSCFFLIHK